MPGEGGPREVAVLGERFRYRRELGRGGMGSVYEAVDGILERRLAVKVLDVRGKRKRLVRHFRQEAQITSQLDHPAIPPIHDYGIDDQGRPYLMMKLVQGESLQAALDRTGEDRLQPEHLERFLQILIKVCEGEPGDSAYIIVEGRCEVFRGSGAERVILREMGPGDAFGETAVVSEKPRTASVEALEDVVLMVVTREALTKGLGISSWVGSFVIGLSERFRDLSDRLQELEDNP